MLSMSRTVISRVPRSSLKWAWPRTPIRRARKRLGVEAGRDVEIGDRRALAANQGEDLVAVDLAGRRLNETDGVVAAGAGPLQPREVLPHRGHLAVPAMALRQD